MHALFGLKLTLSSSCRDPMRWMLAGLGTVYEYSRVISKGAIDLPAASRRRLVQDDTRRPTIFGLEFSMGILPFSPAAGCIQTDEATAMESLGFEDFAAF
jgi:hypothetical protein